MSVSSGFSCKKHANNLCLFHKISVEPTMWLYMMAYMITSVIEQAFFLNKACVVDHDLSEELCLNLSHYSHLKAKVQLTVSEFHQWNNFAGHIVPIILAMFFGNWSDRYGRKAPLIIGLIGKFVYSFMIIINSIMPKWNLTMIVFTASLPMGLLGGDIFIFASCFAYVSDISSVKERTLRVALLDVVYLSAMPTAMLVTVPIMNKLLLLEDTTVVIFGALSHAVGRILFAFAKVWQIFYLGAVAASLGPIAAPALRSIASKIVPSEERGKVFSILSVCDNAVPLLSSVLYSQLYNATIESAPNQIYWLTFASQMVVFLLMLIVNQSSSFKQLLIKQSQNEN